MANGNTEFKTQPLRIVFLIVGIILLVAIYLFQHTDVLQIVCQCQQKPEVHFIVNRLLRVLLNDLVMLWIIHQWFNDRSITRLAFYIQLIDILVLLPLYLFFKLRIEGTSEISSPLLSQFHRLIVNPTLMILIFPAIYFQRFQQTQK